MSYTPGPLSLPASCDSGIVFSVPSGQTVSQ